MPSTFTAPAPLWVDLPGRFIIVDGRFVEAEAGDD
jgi:hypothetical protein